MNKEIRKMREAAEDIARAAPDVMGQYQRGLEAAHEAQLAAARAKEEALTEAEFDQACDAEVRAREKVAFYEKRLESLKYTPRMDEDVYQHHVDAVKATVEKAATAFREAAGKAMDEILAARAAYMEVVTDADNALKAMDDAANVLQSRYRYRIQTYSGTPDLKIEDPYEWKRHALRYNTGTGRVYSLIVQKGAPDADKVNAAWRAAQMVESTCAPRW